MRLTLAPQKAERDDALKNFRRNNLEETLLNFTTTNHFRAPGLRDGRMLQKAMKVFVLETGLNYQRPRRPIGRQTPGRMVPAGGSGKNCCSRSSKWISVKVQDG